MHSSAGFVSLYLGPKVGRWEIFSAALMFEAPTEQRQCCQGVFLVGRDLTLPRPLTPVAVVCTMCSSSSLLPGFSCFFTSFLWHLHVLCAIKRLLQVLQIQRVFRSGVLFFRHTDLCQFCLTFGWIVFFPGLIFFVKTGYKTCSHLFKFELEFLFLGSASCNKSAI